MLELLIMNAALIVLAHSGHAAVDRLAAVDVLHGGLPEEEVHVVLVLHRADKVGRVQVLVIVLLGAQLAFDDERICGGKIGHGSGIQFAA